MVIFPAKEYYHRSLAGTHSMQNKFADVISAAATTVPKIQTATNGSACKACATYSQRFASGTSRGNG